MILLAFFIPLAIYLLILGFINRGRHPLLISGVWDGIGLIFGVSGFLLFAGPAILSALNERWRLFWILGKNEAPLAGAEGTQVWIFLSILYFVLIVGGAAYYFWRQRSLTAIYNTDLAQIERVFTETCEQMGIHPVRSGDLFLFGLSLGLSSPKRDPNATSEVSGKEVPVVLPERGLEEPAIVELDSFPLMRHVTLRWEPADSMLRRTLESELSRHLSETLADDSLLGGWLITVGFILLSFDLAGVFFLILLHIFAR